MVTRHRDRIASRDDGSANCAVDDDAGSFKKCPCCTLPNAIERDGEIAERARTIRHDGFRAIERGAKIGRALHDARQRRCQLVARVARCQESHVGRARRSASRPRQRFPKGRPKPIPRRVEAAEQSQRRRRVPASCRFADAARRLQPAAMTARLGALEAADLRAELGVGPARRRHRIHQRRCRCRRFRRGRRCPLA